MTAITWGWGVDETARRLMEESDQSPHARAEIRRGNRPQGRSFRGPTQAAAQAIPGDGTRAALRLISAGRDEDPRDHRHEQRGPSLSERAGQKPSWSCRHRPQALRAACAGSCAGSARIGSPAHQIRRGLETTFNGAGTGRCVGMTAARAERSAVTLARSFFDIA